MKKLKSRKKPVASLPSSGKTLDYCGEETDSSVLSNLLDESYEMQLKPQDKVYVAFDRRVKKFDPDNPDWEQVAVARSVRWLRNLYKEINGKPYVHSEISLEEKYRPPFAAMGLRFAISADVFVTCVTLPCESI